MEIKFARDICCEDLPRIIAPSSAVITLERALGGHRGSQRMQGLDGILSDVFDAHRLRDMRSQAWLPALSNQLERGAIFLIEDRYSSPTAPLLLLRYHKRDPEQSSIRITGGDMSIQSAITHVVKEISYRQGETVKASKINRWELIIGGAKELANQFYKQQQGSFLEYIGVEAQSIKDITQHAPFTLNNASQQQGAGQIKQAAGTAAVVAGITALGTKGRSLIRAPSDIANAVQAAIRHNRTPSEALGEIGKEQVKTRQGFNTDSRYENRYHGPDDIAQDKNGRLVEIEAKGTGDGNTQVAKNKNGDKQGSAAKNKQRADTMKHKEQQGKVGAPSNRQGGMYTQAEMDLWKQIYRSKGNKRHVSTHTNTNTGQVQVFEREKEGEIINQLDDFQLENFEAVKNAVIQGFKR